MRCGIKTGGEGGFHWEGGIRAETQRKSGRLPVDVGGGNCQAVETASAKALGKENADMF